MRSIPEIRQSLKPPCPALDVHVHPLSCFGLYRELRVEEQVEVLSRAADRSGVKKLCLFSLHRTVPREPSVAEFQEANNDVLENWKVSPDRILPFCYVSPMFPEESVAEMNRCVGDLGFVGIKLWVARRATDPGLDPILKRAVELDVPVLQHAWIKTTGNLSGESFPADVADAARRNPEARIIMAHLNGCGLRGIEDVAGCPNIVVDTSGGDPESGIVEAAVRALGPHRVVYGSDAPIRHFGVQLGKTLGADLPEKTKRDILWNNAARLLPTWAGVNPIEEAGHDR